MKVYMCKVYDCELVDCVDIGVFSTCAKAMEAGSRYIVAAADEDVELLDWDHDTNVYTDYYQGKNTGIYTRIVTETEIDRSL